MNSFKNRSGSGLDTCLVTVGSLWRMMGTGDHIWGTGVAFAGTVKQRCRKETKKHLLVKHVHVHSSRGPLSAGEIVSFCNYSSVTEDGKIPAAGDAGFLVPFIFPEYPTRYRDSSVQQGESRTSNTGLCVVLHKKDESRLSKEDAGGAKQLKVSLPWSEMVQSLSNCTAVASSSLQGIILAEAVGVPSRRVRMSGAPGDFKFSDFYMSYRRIEPRSATSVTEVFNDSLPALPFEERSNYAKKILKTFPVELFHFVET